MLFQINISNRQCHLKNFNPSFERSIFKNYFFFQISFMVLIFKNGYNKQYKNCKWVTLLNS